MTAPASRRITCRTYFLVFIVFQSESVRTWQWLGFIHLPTIIRAHGGEITAESNFGQGTTFHIYLPLRRLKDLEKNSIPLIEETKS